MKATFFAALVAAASAKPLLHQIESYTFADLVEEFNLDFTEGTQEFEIRSAIFEIERARVVAHNKSGASWKENVNHMSHLTGSEKKAFLGRTKGRVPVSQFQKENKTEQLPLADLPASVDWRDAGVVSAVKDQGHCGSCWAFASTATIESHAAINSGELFDLSTQQVAACAANTDECGGTGNCNGATAEIAFAYVASSEGLLEEFEYPYTEYYGIMSQCAVPAAQASKV
jgi:cathepsin L